MVLSFKKEELLAALAATRPALTKLDKAAAAKHKKEEAAYFKEWKAALKQASSWKYDEAKKHSFSLQKRNGSSWYGRGPTCPRSLVSTLDSQIAQVTTSKQTRYRIQDSGWTKALYQTLTVTLPKSKDACEEAAA